MQRPSRNAVLNKSHPLAKDLVGCWLFNEGIGRVINDYSGNNLCCVGTTDLVYKAGGVQITTTDNTKIKHAANPVFQTLGDRSIFVVANLYTARSNRLFSVYNVGATEDCNVLVMLDLDSSNRMRVIYQHGAGNVVSRNSSAVSMTYGEPHSYGVSLSVNVTTDITFSFDGDRVSAGLGNVNATGGSSSEIFLGTHNSVNDSIDGIMYYVLYFSRLLSSGEMRYLHSCPYCMFN